MSIHATRCNSFRLILAAHFLKHFLVRCDHYLIHLVAHFGKYLFVAEEHTDEVHKDCLTAEALREEESDILRLSHMPKRSDGISFYIFVWKKARNQYIVVGFSALPRCRNSAKILQKQLCKTLQRNVFYYMQYVEFKKNSKIP